MLPELAPKLAATEVQPSESILMSKSREPSGRNRAELMRRALELPRIQPPRSKPDMGITDEAIEVNLAYRCLAAPWCHTTAAR